MSVSDIIILGAGGLLIATILWNLVRGGGTPSGDRDHVDLPPADAD